MILPILDRIRHALHHDAEPPKSPPSRAEEVCEAVDRMHEARAALLGETRARPDLARALLLARDDAARMREGREPS